VALSKGVVVLEKFTEADSVSLYVLLDFVHEGLDGFVACVVDVCGSVGRLAAGSWFVYAVYETSGVVKESQILDITLFVTIHLN
jgi:hypothetical protein